MGNVTYTGRGQLVLFDRGGSAPDSTFLYHPQTDVAGGGTGDSNFRLKLALSAANVTIQHGAAGTGNAFPDFTYEYDKVSNISKLTTLSTAGTDTQTFTYDDLNRLLTAGATGGVANYSQTYAYRKIGNMTSFAGTAYAYSGGKPHAVTHLGGVQKFWYDANGNMTSRIEGSTTYTQVFDVENRLTSVTPSGGSATTFAYDATGQRTKTVQPGGVTTYFPFPGYEETVNGANTIKRSSFSLAGQPVAMRVSGDPVSGNNGLFYVLSDHLGSTSMLVNSSGGVVAGSTTRNLPFGGYRGTAPTQTITDRDFTGQKENMELGLLYYQARFYVPGIGRFASADTIVPNPASPQSFNRYAYTLNNPVRYTDPTGHVCYDPGSDAVTPGNCDGGSKPLLPPPSPTVTQLWIDPEAVEEIQLYGNTNTAFENEIGTSSYAYSQGFHGGLDLMASPGTEVVAGIRGKVHWVEDGAYKPNYVVIEIAPDTYIVLGHLSDVQVKVGQDVTPGDVVGVVADRSDVDHLHVEFWTGKGDSIRPRTIEPPYQYMSPEVKAQFLGLMADMNDLDDRITFHNRSDGMWGSIYDQPELIYNGSNLNEGQPGYEIP